MSSLFIKYEAITRHTAIVFMLMEILPLPEPEQSSKKNVSNSCSHVAFLS